MSSLTIAASIRRLRGLMAAQCRSAESDEQLLHAFTAHGDEDAFTVLIGRHGPMVLHVCRRVLEHEQDVEDAFQATFLLLARNATVLHNKSALASFLHGAAYRIAQTAKRSAARRRKHEQQKPTRSPMAPVDELSWREVRTLLDEEIARLPEKYRSAIVLCCLEGLSQAEAARRIGLNERTLSSRLAEARKRLSQRLRRRGVELTAVLTAATLTAPTSALPVGLMATTIKAVLVTAAGEGLAGAVSPSVAELVKNATAAMMVSKVKMVAVVLLAVSLLTAATSGSLESWHGRASGPLAATPKPPAAKVDDKPKGATPQREAATGMEIKGRVLDPEGKPKVGARLLLLPHGTDRKITQLGVSVADGHFTVVVPQVKPEEPMPALIAQADGLGIDFFDLSESKLRNPVELHLVKDRPIRGRVINTEGMPVAGVRVTVENLGIGPDKSMDAFLIEWKKKPFNAGLPFGVQLMTPLDKKRGEAALFDATTGADGRFILRGLGEERFVWLHLSEGGIAAEDLWIVNRGGFDAKPYNQATLDKIPKGEEAIAIKRMLHGPDLSVVAEGEKIIRGTVKDIGSGEGRPNMVVHLSRRHQPALQATTDAQGRFQIRGANKAKSYTLDVAGDATAGYVPRHLEVADSAGYQPINADITVKKGVVITGKMTDRATGKPVRGFVEVAVLVGNRFVKDYPSFDISGWFRLKYTDADGNFRLVAIPGPVLLMGGLYDLKAIRQFKPPTTDPKYPRYFDTGFGPNFPAYIDFESGILPIQGSFCKVLEIKPDAKIVTQDIALERCSVLPIRIEDAEGVPLRGVWESGSDPRRYLAMQCEEATCSAYQVAPDKPRLLVFFHPKRKLAGTLIVKGDETAPVAVRLTPVGALKGRLLDADGQPLAGVVVESSYRDRQARGIERVVHEAKEIVTDASGAFSLEELIPTLKFDLSLRRGKQLFEREAKRAEIAIQVKPGECRDLGAIKVRRVAERLDE